jgi:hypothetical protein
MVAQAAEPVLLREEMRPDDVYQVRMRTDLSGTLLPPVTKEKPNPKPLDLAGSSAFEYVERVLIVEQGQVTKTVRSCQRIELQRTVADQPQQNKLRPAVHRLVVLRNKGLKAPFSPDGPLMWSEIDLMRSDVFTPALSGLLPGKAVRIGDQWNASVAALQELTGLERIEDGEVVCRLEDVVTRDGERHARIGYSGTIKGSAEDGTTRHKIEGYFLFDLKTNHLRYLFLNGVQSLIDSTGKEVGRNQGRFVLERTMPAASAEISAEGLRGIGLDPTAENTLLLYDNPTLGVRFTHPRRWWPSGVRGQQVMMDSADGHGVMLTVEALNQLPTGDVFLAESRKWLEQKKARLLRVDPVRPVADANGVEHFALEAELAGVRFLMDYHVIRQAKGGATLAARLVAADQESARREIDRLARSLVITRRINPK